MGYHLSRKRVFQFEESAERHGVGLEQLGICRAAIAEREQSNPAMADCSSALISAAR